VENSGLEEILPDTVSCKVCSTSPGIGIAIFSGYYRMGCNAQKSVISHGIIKLFQFDDVAPCRFYHEQGVFLTS
jgi:hypothetical protein